MNNRYKWIGFILIVVIFISIAVFFIKYGFVIAQNDPEIDFERSKVLLGDGKVDESIALLKKIIEDNPESSIAVMSRFQLAGIYGFIKKDSEKMVQEYEAVVRDYPGSIYEFDAKTFLIDCFYLKDDVPFDVWLEKTNELIVEFGGISIYDILNTKDLNSEKWWDTIRKDMFKFGNDVLADRYYIVGCSFNGARPKRRNEALKMFQFVRTYFPHFERGSENIISLTDTILATKNIGYLGHFDADESPPVIRAIAPRAGLTIGDKRPKIEVELHDGDIAKGQVELNSLVFTLNEQDLTKEMKVKINYNTSCKPRVIFEKIRLIYRPEEELPAGEYTVTVKANDRLGHSSEESWSFNIK